MRVLVLCAEQLSGKYLIARFSDHDIECERIRMAGLLYLDHRLHSGYAH